MGQGDLRCFVLLTDRNVTEAFPLDIRPPAEGISEGRNGLGRGYRGNGVSKCVPQNKRCKENVGTDFSTVLGLAVVSPSILFHTLETASAAAGEATQTTTPVGGGRPKKRTVYNGGKENLKGIGRINERANARTHTENG